MGQILQSPGDHNDVVFYSYAPLSLDVDALFVGKCHPLFQHQEVSFHDARGFVASDSQTVPRAMNEILPVSLGFDHVPGSLVHIVGGETLGRLGTYIRL